MKTKLSFAAVFFAAICFVSTLTSCINTKPIEPAELEGYWALKTMHGKDAKTLFSGALPTLKFDFEKMLISGTGGCNRYSGEFTFEKNVLKAPNLAFTRMLCFDENAEPEFLLELVKDNTLSLTGGILTFTNRDKEVVFEFVKGEAVNETPVNVTSEMLEGNWILKQIEGAEAVYVFSGENAKIPNLTIDVTENRVFGNAGCNSYNAPFSLENNIFVLMPAATTQMACPNLEGETKYLKNLQDTLLISLPNPNILLLIKNNQTVLEFEKSEE